jgi:hypothetical protein
MIMAVMMVVAGMIAMAAAARGSRGLGSGHCRFRGTAAPGMRFRAVTMLVLVIVHGHVPAFAPGLETYTR